MSEKHFCVSVQGFGKNAALVAKIYNKKKLTPDQLTELVNRLVLDKMDVLQYCVDTFRVMTHEVERINMSEYTDRDHAHLLIFLRIITNTCNDWQKDSADELVFNIDLEQNLMVHRFDHEYHRKLSIMQMDGVSTYGLLSNLRNIDVVDLHVSQEIILGDSYIESMVRNFRQRPYDFLIRTMLFEADRDLRSKLSISQIAEISRALFHFRYYQSPEVFVREEIVGSDLKNTVFIFKILIFIRQYSSCTQQKKYVFSAFLELTHNFALSCKHAVEITGRIFDHYIMIRATDSTSVTIEAVSSGRPDQHLITYMNRLKDELMGYLKSDIYQVSMMKVIFNKTKIDTEGQTVEEEFLIKKFENLSKLFKPTVCDTCIIMALTVYDDLFTEASNIVITWKKSICEVYETISDFMRRESQKHKNILKKMIMEIAIRFLQFRKGNPFAFNIDILTDSVVFQPIVTGFQTLCMMIALNFGTTMDSSLFCMFAVMRKVLEEFLDIQTFTLEQANKALSVLPSSKKVMVKTSECVIGYMMGGYMNVKSLNVSEATLLHMWSLFEEERCLFISSIFHGGGFDTGIDVNSIKSMANDLQSTVEEASALLLVSLDNYNLYEQTEEYFQALAMHFFGFGDRLPECRTSHKRIRNAIMLLIDNRKCNWRRIKFNVRLYKEQIVNKKRENLDLMKNYKKERANREHIIILEKHCQYISVSLKDDSKRKCAMGLVMRLYQQHQGQEIDLMTDVSDERLLIAYVHIDNALRSAHPSLKEYAQTCTMSLYSSGF